jgi:Saxitoxin biosynthesis operon protein SxtJ
MQFSDINRNPNQRTLRQFAALLILILGGMAAWKGNYAAAAVVAAIGLLGLAIPAALRPIYVAWMIVAFPIGWLVSHVMLAVLYFVLFLPLGLMFRLLGRDALSLRKPSVETYWTEKQQPEDVVRYFRQY